MRTCNPNARGKVMECPQCRKTILAPAERCSSCGYIYPGGMETRLSVYFDLRKELETLRSALKTHVWPGVERISGRIDLLEKALAADLQTPETSEERIPREESHSGPAGEGISEPQEEGGKDRSVSVDTIAREKVLSPETKRNDSSQLEIRLGQKWLLIVGIVTMVFGIGYFLKYSFDRGWIGPAGRVAMAYLWGLALLTGGNRFRRTFETFGLYVIGGGIATLYFSTFAGFQIYHLFGQLPSFFIMTMITALACLLSVIHDAKWLAVLGLIGGFFTPVMLSTGQDNQIALMTYMSILNFGLLGIAFHKKWNLLNYLGFAFTYLLYVAWFTSYYQDSKFWPSIIFLNIFYLTYSIIPFAYESLREKAGNTGTFLVPALNSFIAFGFGYEMIRKYSSLEWVSVITIFYSLVSLLMAGFLYKRGERNRDAFVMLSAKAALFLIITVPMIFSRHWITIFWAAQAVTLLWAGLRLERKQLLFGSYLLLGFAAGKFLLYDYSAVFRFDFATWSMADSYSYLLLERLLTSGFLLLAIRRFSVMLTRSHGEAFSLSGADDHRIFSALFGILVFICLNVETSSFFTDYLPDAQPAALCVLWTIQSFALLRHGIESGKKGLLIPAYLLFMLAAGKFFLYDYGAVYHFTMSDLAISAPYTSLLIERLTTAALLLSFLYFSSSLLRKNPADILASRLNIRGEYVIHDALFWFMLFVILNMEAGSLFHEYLPSARFAAVSVLWALFSVALMIRGFSSKSLCMRRTSLGLFLLTLMKVFLFDMANVDTPYRIVSFIVVGLLLVGTSYLYHRFRDRIMGSLPETDGAGIAE
jgi:uncharacterized membrane protein